MFGTARDDRFGIARPKIVRDGTFSKGAKGATFTIAPLSLDGSVEGVASDNGAMVNVAPQRFPALPDLAPELLRFLLGG